MKLPKKLIKNGCWLYVTKGRQMTNPDSLINEEAETKAIENWLRMVDKPLATKKGDKEGREPRDE